MDLKGHVDYVPTIFVSDSERLTFLKEKARSPKYLCITQVIPQFVPLNGLHAGISVLRIGAVQAECVYMSVQWKFVWEKLI